MTREEMVELLRNYADYFESVPVFISGEVGVDVSANKPMLIGGYGMRTDGEKRYAIHLRAEVQDELPKVHRTGDRNGS